MTLGGEYATRNYTVKHLQDLKGKTILTETMPFTTREAVAAEEAGIDTLKVKFDPANPADAIAMRKAAPHTFMTFCIGLTKIATADEAVRAGYIAMEAGADGIMCQWGPKLIRAVSDAGIPGEADTGLVPRLSTWTGGLRAVGKTIEETMWIFEQIKSFEKAGAWAVEVVPAQLLAEISKRTRLVTSSIGAGSGGIQFMFAEDILGCHAPPYPRHTKQYRDLIQDGTGDSSRARQWFPGLYRRCQKRYVPRPTTHRQRPGGTDQSVPVRSGRSRGRVTSERRETPER
jgi:3-methyl-2-oxobutanoate hydroxymethyltransferase